MLGLGNIGGMAEMMAQLPKLQEVFDKIVATADAMLESQKRMEAEQKRQGELLNLLAEKAGIEFEPE